MYVLLLFCVLYVCNVNVSIYLYESYILSITYYTGLPGTVLIQIFHNLALLLPSVVVSYFSKKLFNAISQCNAASAVVLGPSAIKS